MIILDGIIIVNKEQGYTSNDVVQIVKKTFNEKVGHTGTLDPMATGVLPILIGKGTLLSKYLINHDKIYVATLKLGIKTDTGDITGDIINESKVDTNILNEKNVLNALEEIKGKQEQIPPMYSGTYIRTLCEKIAEMIGTIGTMSSLNREKVGEFEISQAIKVDEIKENFNLNNLISIEKFFQDKNKIKLSPRSFIAFINGVKLLDDNEDGIYRIYNANNEFVGIGTVKKGILKRDIVI